MALGTLSHDEHELRLARWNAHHDAELTAASREWTRRMLDGARSRTAGAPAPRGSNARP